MSIKAEELIEETGCTYRKIDYWVRNGIIPTIKEPTPGSGYYRSFDESVIDRIKFLDAVSKAFKRSLSLAQLKQVYDAYEDGVLVLDSSYGYEIVLSWEVAE